MAQERLPAMNESTYRYYHSQDFALYDFGPDHAFKPIRQELTADLALRASLLRPDEVTPPREAEDWEIALFHTPAFIEAVKAADTRPVPMTEYGLGTPDNPLFPSMHRASALRVGATLDAVRAVALGHVEHAANFAGGLHHAVHSRASGFCIYNDIGVAIRWLRRELDCKVAYVDFDAHHGDGVQWGFYDDPDVLTLSIHESGRYLFPGTGHIDEIGEGAARGTSVNIPLLPETRGENWLECLERVLPDVLEAFKPDIIITQHGCDTHRLDPLAHLSVSVDAVHRATQMVHRLAHDLCGGRWVALGGGGYAVWQVVPRAWALVWAALSDRPAPERIPEAWLAAWSGQSPVPLPQYWFDVTDELPSKDGADLELVWRHQTNLETADAVRAAVLPHLKRRRFP